MWENKLPRFWCFWGCSCGAAEYKPDITLISIINTRGCLSQPSSHVCKYMHTQDRWPEHSDSQQCYQKQQRSPGHQRDAVYEARAHLPPHRVLIYSSDCKAPFFLLNSNLNDNQVHTGFISAVPLQKRIFSSHPSTVKNRLECASPSLRTPKLRDACWRESSQEPTSQFGVETPSLHCPVSSKKDTAYPKEWKWGMSSGRKSLEGFSPKKEAPVGVYSKLTREAVH